MESPKKHFMVARDMAEKKAFERMNRKNAEPGVEADAKCQQVSDACKHKEHSKHCSGCNHYGTA